MGRKGTAVAILVAAAGSYSTVVTAVDTGDNRQRLTLPDLVVTATRNPIPEDEAPAGTTIITRDDIDAMPEASTLNDILRTVPGISLQGRARDGRSSLSIRGLEDKHTLILVDGRRIPNTDDAFAHSDFRAQPVPIAAIERIEVIRGPMSALYGSDAMGGVINVITQAPDEDWRGRVVGRLGTADKRGGDDARGSLSGAGQLPNGIGGTFALERGERDPIRSPDFDAVDEIEGRDHLIGFAQGFIPFGSDHELSLRYRGGEDERKARTGTAFELRDRRLRLDDYGISWRTDFARADWVLDLYQSEARERDRTGERDPQRLRDRIADTRVNLYPSDNTIFTLGAEYREERYDDESMTRAESSYHRRLYTQMVTDFLDNRVTVAVGGTYLDNNRFGSDFSPRASASLRISENWTAKAAYGEAFAVPQIKELSPNFLSEGQFPGGRPFDIRGNPDVDPERSRGYEIGVLRTDIRWSAGINLFRNDVRDLIETRCVENCGPPQFGAPLPLREYTNINRTRTEGSEVFLQARPVDRLELNVNHTYLRAIDRDTRNRLEGRPEHTVNVAGTWHFTPRLSAGGNLRYIGRQTALEDDEATRLPGYTLLGLSVQAKPIPALRIQVGVDNVGDIRLADRNEAFRYEERGRFYFAQVDYRFGPGEADR